MDYKELEEKLTSTKRKMDKADFEKKLRANKYIMNTLSEDEINSYLEQCDYQAVIDLVDKVYGKEASDILKERALSTDDIPTFNIFDSRIQEAIGYGGVHTFLTYYMDSSIVIDKMVENPNLITLYNIYKEQITNFYSPSAIGLQESLLTFDKHKNLLNEISKAGWTDELRDNFLLRIRDEETLNNFIDVETADPNVWYVEHLNNAPHNIEELKNYKNSREQLLNKEILESPAAASCQTLLKFKYFGNIRENNNYNHEYFLKDYLSFYTSEFSDYEISAIYLYSIIEQTNDFDVLKQIDTALSKTEHITPLDMKPIDSKVAEVYRKEYLNSTITLEKAEKMAENRENGSYKGILKSDGSIVCIDHILTPNGIKQERALLPTEDIITKSTDYKGSNYTITMSDGKTYSQKEKFNPIVFAFGDNNVEISVAENSSVHETIFYNNNGIPVTFHITNSDLVSFEINGGVTRNGSTPLAQRCFKPILANPDYQYMKEQFEPEIKMRQKIANLPQLFSQGKILTNDISYIEKDEQPVYFLNTTETTFFNHKERGFTSKPLLNKINSTIGEEYLNISKLATKGKLDATTISPEEFYIINNTLEGGLTSISAYYNNSKCNNWISYVNKIHPNSIFKRSPGDGMVSHNRKILNHLR
ncbi:MAG: hypothetical protein ACLUWN_01610 [Clostridia bacterium]|jgi:hypothetical protein